MPSGSDGGDCSLSDGPRRSARRAPGTALVATVALLAAAVLSSHDSEPSPATQAPPSGQLRVLTWNICGEAGGRRGTTGYCPYRNDPAAKVQEIVKAMAEHQADAVALQEICGGAPGSHASMLTTALGPRWSVRAAAGSRPDGTSACRGGLKGRLGVAVAVRGKITSSTTSESLPASPRTNKDSKPLLCVTVAKWSYGLCTIHILPGADPRVPSQVRQVAGDVLKTGRPVVLAGDFNRNSRAAELAPLDRDFTECRRWGDGTPAAPTFHRWDISTGRHVFHTLDHVYVHTAGGFPARFASCGVDHERMDTTRNTTDAPPPSGQSDHAPVHVVVRGR
ncbi:endonuclease/exonuclease/phosphatase family protein [Streptomyces peucetius]|uniref:Endonuclease/exonuclease/phosphatase family protein n=2 Tax=Streptomyces peucetius TaxID=1950 RepID=A0ABY6ILD9_STRPE|nr:endonuclease/exonuclease/phosphatase family protein [Streptomyces peucetius]